MFILPEASMNKSTKRNIFLLGAAGNVYTVEYIKNVRNLEKENITILSYAAISKKISDEYNNLGVNVEYLGVNCSKLRKAIASLYFAAKHRRARDIDVLEIHYPASNSQAYFVSLILKILNVPSLVTYWGSDILRINREGAKKQRHILNYATKINLPSKSIHDKFIFFYGHDFDEKIVSAPFASPSLEELNNQMRIFSKSEAKKSLGFDQQRICVSVGYSGKKYHQHLKVIEQLSKMSNAEKQKFYLVVHLAGICDPLYQGEIEAALKRSGFDYSILPESFSLKRMAMLEIATDIFIHAQVSDALSSTVREYIFAKTVLVNPDWIKYQEFEDLGVKFIQYKDFSELPTILTKLLDGEINIDKDANSRLIYDNFSWKEAKPKWDSIYNELFN